MTSNPASRSARATIFAPRSWPSRPGLATITRSFSGIGAESSEALRLRPCASAAEDARVELRIDHARPADGAYTAYGTLGDGLRDIVRQMDRLCDIELIWEEQAFERFLKVKGLVAGSGSS